MKIIMQYDYIKIIAGFFLLTCLLSGCTITSRHFDETMDDPGKRWEMESKFKTEEERKYWERVKKNRGGFKIYLPDSLDNTSR